MEYANLSVEEIQRQLDEAESKKAQLKRLLEVRRQEGKDEVVQQVKDIITSNGYELSEILGLISPRRRRGSGPAPRKPASNRQYRRYVDPDNADNVYVRGVLPGWMKDKMKTQGYDPASKDDREAFKANSLTALEA
ncbi:H-NS histone family protein [Thiocystis violacea]|nr:H-NS histone family protein [Thiocystis violacea]